MSAIDDFSADYVTYGINRRILPPTNVNGLPPSNPYYYPAMQESDYLALQMMEKYNKFDWICGYWSFFTTASLSDIMNLIEETYKETLLEYRSINRYSILVFENSMIVLNSNDESSDQEETLFGYNVFFYGHRKNYDDDFFKLRKIDFAKGKVDRPYITWATQTVNGIKTNRLMASENKDVKDVFYPSINKLYNGLSNFYDCYDNSTSPILVVLGPPGMGKTSLIRNFIYKYNKSAVVTYDQALMETDEFFLYFLEHEHNLLLLEDFDIFLKSREDNDNKIMNKFLNLSEGIVDISGKKIIVTANLDKIQIDSALTRPGRCFDVLELNRYTKDQAKKIILDENLTFTGNCDNVTLAELFANKQRLDDRQPVGFTRLR